jgi:transposase
VFCFDEKTQCQALDRTQPSLPMTRGRAGTIAPDYKRNGTTDVSAALNVATGEVLYDTRKRQSAEDVLALFKPIDLHVPRDLEVSRDLGRPPGSKGSRGDRVACPSAPARWHLHFIPTSSSWRNLVDRWFKELNDRRLRRGDFSSVAALIDAIESWAAHWNDDPKPFVRHAEAGKILERVRGRATLTRIKSATHD